MKSDTWLLHILLLLFISFITRINGRLNLIVKKFENCDSTVDYPNKFYTTFRTVGGYQYVDGNASFRVALDNNIKSDFTAELLVGKRYMQVIRIEDKHTCSMMHRYVGELAYDIERAAQLVPGLCPIPPGRYHIHNYRLNYNLVTLQNFPFGHLRLKVITTDKNNKLVTCILLEAENQNF